MRGRSAGLAGALGVSESTPPPPGGEGTPPPPGGEAGAGDHEDQTYDLPLPAFVKAHKLPGNAERALALVAWATKRDGAESFTPAQVETYWKKTPWKKPANIGRDVGKAANQGWLEQPAKGCYALTGYGESHLADLRSE